MKYLDNMKFNQINPNNLSAKFLKVREYFFTKNKISVFANKLFIYMQDMYTAFSNALENMNGLAQVFKRIERYIKQFHL